VLAERAPDPVSLQELKLLAWDGDPLTSNKTVWNVVSKLRDRLRDVLTLGTADPLPACGCGYRLDTQCRPSVLSPSLFPE
jgi:hypothetical protein